MIDPPPPAGAALSPRKRPPWLGWELRFTDHVRKRMVERGLAETELRHILEYARRYRRSPRPGVYLVSGRVRRNAWAIAVRPDRVRRRVTVVTAFPLSRIET